MFVEFITSVNGKKRSVRVDAIILIQEYELKRIGDKKKEKLYSKHGEKHTGIRLIGESEMLSVVGNYEETMAKINAVIGKTDEKD